MTTRLAHLSVLFLVAVGGCANRGARSSPTAGIPREANFTGRWNVTISVGGATITGLALLTQAGNSITGSMGPNEDNQHPLEGVVEAGRIALTMRPRPGRITAFDKSYLTMDGGTLRGTTEGGRADQGVIQLVRVRE